MSVLQARALGLTNYSVLVSHVRVPPAMDAILSSPANRVQGFLLAGHVCAVMGYHEYPPLLEKYRVPMAVTGFEPLDLVRGILETVKLLEAGKVEIVNAYSARRDLRGQPCRRRRSSHEVFEECDRKWRGIGTIPMSGWRLRPEFDAFNAETKFDVARSAPRNRRCASRVRSFRASRSRRTVLHLAQPARPSIHLGATMVSSEGACAAYYRYGRVTIPA